MPAGIWVATHALDPDPFRAPSPTTGRRRRTRAPPAGGTGPRCSCGGGAVAVSSVTVIVSVTVSGVLSLYKLRHTSNTDTPPLEHFGQHLSRTRANPAHEIVPAPTITIPERIRDEIVAHARERTPEEACGILAGTRGDEASRVEARHPAENVAETRRTRYEIDPREQLDLLETIEASGREVVGFYHSHPRGPAGPSATDAAQATWPDRSYVIVSLGRGDDEDGEGSASVGSWRWTGEEFVAENVRVMGSES